MNDINFKTYQSPFSWRYGTDSMRQIFSEEKRRRLWRKIWVALAKAQNKAGLIADSELNDLKKNEGAIDLKRSQEIEKEIYHDLMAEVRVFAEKAKVGGGKIHLGATSMDISDNADTIRIKEAMYLIEKELIDLLRSFASKIKKYQDVVCMGYTHLQPAEPTTLGYRLSLYAQDLLNDLKLLRFVKDNLKAKGIKGAVGTSASYERLLKDKKMDAFKLEREVMSDLNLPESTVAGQTYPRKSDLHFLMALSSIAQSIHKFCLDLRLMQSPNFGEWSEPRDPKRVGSSAMPFKRNPDKSEKICSLARYIQSMVQIPWDNAANSFLERTLDDSANRRIFIPESFLAADEILSQTNKLVEGLIVYEENIKKNLDRYGRFAGTEVLMMEAVKRSANRQEIHEAIRKISQKAWEEINYGNPNPLVDLLKHDKIISKFVKSNEIDGLADPAAHIGIAAKRCQLFLKELKEEKII